MNKPQFPFDRPEYLCQVGYEDAYNALSEPYQNDSCLTFHMVNGILCADGDVGKFFWNKEDKVWMIDYSHTY